MIVPAAPPKYVQSSKELVIGEKYHVDSGMGGVWVVIYRGRGDLNRCEFEFENKELAMYNPHHIWDHLVSKHVMIIQHFDTIKEWQAAGGRWKGRG